MSHKRTEIRIYLVDRLLNGDTNADSRVHNSKINAEHGPFPAIAVYTTGERKLEKTSENPEYRKEITVELQAVVEQSDTYADDLDDLCLQIEALLDFDYFLGGQQNGIVESFEPDETQILFSNKGDIELAMAMMTYKATYIAILPDNTASLDKFNTFHGDIDTANDQTTEGETGPDGQIEADIHITGLNP